MWPSDNKKQTTSVLVAAFLPPSCLVPVLCASLPQNDGRSLPPASKSSSSCVRGRVHTNPINYSCCRSRPSLAFQAELNPRFFFPIPSFNKPEEGGGREGWSVSKFWLVFVNTTECQPLEPLTVIPAQGLHRHCSLCFFLLGLSYILEMRALCLCVCVFNVCE